MNHFIPLLTGAVILLALPPSTAADGSVLALWGIVITTLGGIITQLIIRRADIAKAEQQHKFQMEAAHQAAKDREVLMLALAENTRLTKTGVEKADLAYETANNVNEKIASLGIAARLLDGSENR